MQPSTDHKALAVLASIALHAAALVLVSNHSSGLRKAEEPPQEQVLLMEVFRAQPEPPSPRPEIPSVAPVSQPTFQDSIRPATDPAATVPEAPKQLATMDAPPPPSAEEWAFAARYTNKNSKGYRYSWGQQVRSMMGTAVEGPDQGVVRFRVEIAPDGTLVKLETLWTTSTVAERLARQAIGALPPLPPTPTGKPLIFEKTISFTPFASDGPPVYRDDCLPDPPTFRNPFAWDGQSAQVRDEAPEPQKLDPQALEECLRQLPKDSFEAEMAHDKRIMDRWGSKK